MRAVPVLLLSLAALAAAGAAGWYLLRPASPPAAGSGGSPPPGDPARDPAVEGTEPPPLASTGGSSPGTVPRPPRDPARRPPDRPAPLRGPDAWKQEKDGVPPRDPKPLPEGVSPGECIPEGLTEADEREVAALREKMLATPLKAARFHGRALGSLAKEIAEASGIPVELSGEDLADEPVTGEFNDSDAFDRLMQVAVGRNLRLEVRPDRVVIRR